MPSRRGRHSPRSWYPVGPQQELVTRHYLLTGGHAGEKASSELELSAWELNRSRSMKLLSSRLWSLEVAVVTAHDLG